MFKKDSIVVPSFVAALDIYLVTFYFEETYFITSVLVVGVLVLLWTQSFSRESVLMFLVVGILGFFAESLVVTNGAWVYQSQHLLGLPVWLPLLWGSVGIVSIRLVNRLQIQYEKKK